MTIIVTGTVTKGDEYGKTIGFPTANLSIEALKDNQDMKEGVYSGYAILPDKTKYSAGIVVRFREKYNKLCAEAHLIDDNNDLYGQVITLEIETFLRPYRIFENEKLLKQAILKDIKDIQEMN